MKSPDSENSRVCPSKMCFFCLINIICRRKGHDGPDEEQAGGHHHDAEEKKEGVIKGLAQSVDPKVVEFAASKLSAGFKKYKKRNKNEEKKEEEGSDKKDPHEDKK